MAETRTYNGYVYTRSAAGEPWTMQGPAQGDGRQATVISNPFRARDEARKDEDQQFQRNADARSAASDARAAQAEERQRQAEARANAAEARAAEKDAQDQKTRNARGGVDTTEAERTAAFLATRLAGGLRDIKTLGAVPAPSLKDAVFGGTMLGNYTTDQKRQRTINAQREVLDAALTLGTGAAYTQEQLDNYRTAYFPQPGDAPETIADKSRRLQTALNAARLKAGASAGMIDEALAPVQESKPVVQADPRGELQPDGTFVKDGSQVDREGNYLGLAGGVTDDGPTSPAPVTPSPSNGGYANSYLGQGMYGANEGLASTLGLPVDAATMALNLVPKGLNAIANTDLPEIQNPFLGGEWWKGALTDLGSIGPTSQDADKQFARRVGQSVGAAAVPIAGAEAGVGKVAQALLSSAAGGAGAATAQQLFPGNPYAEIAGELAGSMGTGAGFIGANRRAAQREIEAAVPSIPKLKEQASGLYEQAELNGTTAGPQQTDLLAQAMRQTLRDEGQLGPSGRITNADTSTNKALNLIEQYQGLPMKPNEMNSVRRVLAEGRSSLEPSDQRMAKILTGQFDDWARPMVPGFDEARDVSSRYLQAQTLENARNVADTRTSANSLRNEYANLERRDIKGGENFSPEVGAAIDSVVKGTPMSRALDLVGKAAPTGVVSGGLSAGVPFMMGNALGGPVMGAAMGATSLTAGAAAKSLAAKSVGRRAEIAELLARNGGPLEQAPVVDPETQRLIAAMLAGQAAQRTN